MPEIPRDPHQLARDILAGKISIEEIARQRQAHSGQPSARPAAPQQVAQPQRVPKPVIAPPVQRQFPQQQRPRPLQPKAQQQGQRSRPQQQSMQKPRPQPQAAVQPAPVQVIAAPAKPLAAPRLTGYSSPNLHIRGLTRNRETLRQAMIMAEILAKPIALRDEF